MRQLSLKTAQVGSILLLALATGCVETESGLETSEVTEQAAALAAPTKALAISTELGGPETVYAPPSEFDGVAEVPECKARGGSILTGPPVSECGSATNVFTGETEQVCGCQCSYGTLNFAAQTETSGIACQGVCQNMCDQFNAGIANPNDFPEWEWADEDDGSGGGGDSGG